MAFAAALHQWSIFLIPPLGFLLNLLLVWLILRRTPKEMRVHSRILLQTCLFDCLFLVALVVGTPMPLSNLESTSMYIFKGYLVKQLESVSGPEGLNLLNTVFYLFYYFNIFSVCIQFVYRYMSLNLDISIKLGHYLAMLSVAISVDVGLQFLFIFLVSITIKQDTEQPLLNVTIDVNEVVLVLEVEKNLAGELLLLIYAMLFIACYAIISFCAWKMVRFVNAHAGFNQNLKSLNRQLTRNLIILASLPFLLTSLNLLAAIIVTTTKDPLLDFKYVIYTLMSSVPLLNPVVSILTNRPYRDAVASWLCCCCCCCKKNGNEVQPIHVKTNV